MELSVKANPTWVSIGWISYFFTSIALVGAVFAYLLSLPLYILGRLIKPLKTAADRVLHRGIYLLMAIQPWFDAQIDIQLPPPPYKNGLLLVANHRSHLDAFILLSRIPGLRFIGHKHLFFNPIIGPMLWAMGSIPAGKTIDSLWTSMERLKEQLEEGEIVCVFPELTRCPPGFKGIQEMTSAPFLAATKAQTTVIPIVITGTDAVWPKGEIGIKSSHKITANSLSPIELNLKTEALQLRNKVAKLFHEQLV